jgi:hypothetical protein
MPWNPQRFRIQKKEINNMNSLPSHDNYHCPITSESMAYDAMTLYPCGHHISEPGVQSIIEQKDFFYDFGNLAKLLEENRVDCPLCRERITNVFQAREHRQILQHIDQIAERADIIIKVKEEPESDSIPDYREDEDIMSAMLHKFVKAQVQEDFDSFYPSLQRFVYSCRSIRLNNLLSEESMISIEEHYLNIKNQLRDLSETWLAINDQLRQNKVSIMVPIEFDIQKLLAKEEVHRAYDAYKRGGNWLNKTAFNLFGFSNDEVTSFFVR